MLLAGSITQLVLTAAIMLVGIATLFIVGLIVFMAVYMAIERLTKEVVAHTKGKKQA